MDIFDIKQTLQSFTVLVDSREQDNKRARKRYESFGCPFRRSALNYGDYTYNATLPNGETLFDADQTVSGHCVIERKMDLTELSGCLCQSRERFKREFERAAEHGARVYLIIEDGSWEHLMNGKYRTKFNPNAFMGSLTAFMVRYNLNVIFCKEESTGKIIREILYRDLKERLERGDYG